MDDTFRSIKPAETGPKLRKKRVASPVGKVSHGPANSHRQSSLILSKILRRREATGDIG